MSCRALALTVLLDAVDDATGRIRTDSSVTYRDTSVGEGKRLKDNALDFLFSKESESYCLYWCDIADEPIERFRDLLKKYKK